MLKKKVFSLVLATVLSLAQVSSAFAAETSPKEDFIINEGVLTAYNGSAKLVKVPDTVTAIGENAFKGANEILEIELPDSVKTIGKEGFAGCTKLSSIDLGISLTDIGNSAFKDCKSLRYVALPETLQTIGEKAFYSSGLNYVKFPGALTSIGDNSFFNTQLRAAQLNSGLKKIGRSAFETCYKLQGLRIPASVEEIGSNAITDNVSGFKWLLIENDNIAIGGSLTDDYTAIDYYGGESSTFKNYYDALYAKNNNTKIKFLSKTGFVKYSSFEPEESNKRLEAGTSDYIIRLKEETAGATAGVINYISGNTRIAEVDETGRITAKRVGEAEILMFTADSEYATVKIEVVPNAGNLFKIENGVLTDYYGHDADIVIPEEATSISASAFAGSDYIKSVKLGTKIHTIKDGAFEGCVNLESIDINGAPLSYIGKRTFSDCTGLKKFTVPSSVDSLMESAFEGCKSLETVDMSEAKEIYSLPKYVFSGCKSLGTVTVPQNCTTIGEAAFSGNSALLTVNFNKKLKKIEKRAFDGANSLESLTIPSGVTEIGDGAFWGMSKLRTIEFPETFEKFGGKYFATLFDKDGAENAGSLESVNFNPRNDNYYTYKGCVYSGQRLVYVPNGMKELNVREGTVTIGDGAAFEHMNLEKAVIPDSVYKIGDSAFRNCFGLKSIRLPDTVEEIGTAAFLGCEELEGLTIPKNTKTIGGLAYYELEKVKELTVPDGVTKIESYAVSGMDDMQHLTLSRNLTEIADNGCAFCPSLEELYLPEKLTAIGKEGFGMCAKLEYLELPESLKKVGAKAFGFAHSLKSAYIFGGTELKEASNYGNQEGVFHKIIDEKGEQQNRIIYVFTHEPNDTIKRLESNHQIKLVDMEYIKNSERKVELRALENLITGNLSEHRFRTVLTEKQAERGETTRINISISDRDSEVAKTEKPLKLIVELKPEEEGNANFGARLLKNGKTVELETKRVHRFIEINLTELGDVAIYKRSGAAGGSVENAYSFAGGIESPGAEKKDDEKTAEADETKRTLNKKSGKNTIRLSESEIDEIISGEIQKIELITARGSMNLGVNTFIGNYEEGKPSAYLSITESNKRAVLPQKIKGKLLSKHLYSVSLRISGKEVRATEGDKLSIYLKLKAHVKLKGKQIIVYNYKTGELIKAKYLSKSHKVKFVTDKTGDFIIIAKNR